MSAAALRWSLVLLVVGASACSEPPLEYDLVLSGGRVMDPESGLDAVRDVGILDGRIVSISEEPLRGERILDVSGLVVAPGFIDLHEHGQTGEAYGLMVRDGVTSAFELEVGTADVAQWYDEREGGQIINYGVSAGHIPARMAVLGDPGNLLPAGIGGSGTATEAQIVEMEEILRKGLDEGAVAVGLGSAYTPGAPMSEIERMFRVGAAAGASSHIHIRGGVAGLDSTIAAARSAGSSLHLVHINSVADDSIETFLARIEAAVAGGHDVTTEAYPYGAGMTEITSALFDDWETWPDERFGIHQWVDTGERLTRESFGRYRAQGGTVIIHSRPESQTRTTIASPFVMIASDGYIQNGRGHPRTSGSYAKVLGTYVRDEGVVDLMTALRRMTLLPARRLEGTTPLMTNKGRIRAGADADIVVFDAATVQDRSTYEDATLPSMGIPYVLVHGVLVVEDGELVPGAHPGTAIRAPLNQGM